MNKKGRNRKGVMYSTEKIIRKAGKAAVGKGT